MFLDPKSCAVGTAHISADGKRAYTIVARDIKSDQAVGGFLMVAKYFEDGEWKSQTFHQQTGLAVPPAVPSVSFDARPISLHPVLTHYERWIVVTPQTGYETYSQARAAAEDRNALAVLKVSFHKGEGLTFDEKGRPVDTRISEDIVG